ncbi:MAG: GHKL domain-containing protein [Agathobacter sp.]|nr:GHKL domain-containing protein [Agathobacter sp.]
MNNIENYWAIVSHSTVVINYLLEGWLVYRYVKPFMKNKPHIVGICYSVIMLLFFCIPQEITYPNLQGAVAAWIVMCLLEKRKVKQKAFLATTMYLFRWVVYGVTLVLRNMMFDVFINTEYLLYHPLQQVIVYGIVEIIYYGIAITVMYLVIKLIHKVYVNKKEDITGKELLLLFATLLSVMLGYFTFNFLSNVYIEDMQVYIWDVHPKYTLLRAIYQIVSFAAILIALAVYQKMKEKQREEKENILLAEQIENTRQHISEVEKLYADIRALKHDMGNHISVLEHLFLKNETEELEKYMAQLKKSLSESVAEIKTGNPVTDVILTEKQKEADEKGIQFDCQFIYPIETNVNAFDISVILNNAIENAFEGVSGCEKPYVLISAYRKKNAYMLEMTNCTQSHIEIDDETGLPMSTKADRNSHGFGLSNIRKVAQKYYGDIDISLDENKFTLIVMLMVE